MKADITAEYSKDLHKQPPILFSSTDNDKSVNSFSNEKIIKEDSIIYFSEKLIKTYTTLKIYLYFSLLLCAINIFFCYCLPYIFINVLNIPSIIFLLFCAAYFFLLFKNNFDFVSKDIYLAAKRTVYMQFGALCMNILSIFYTLFFKIIPQYKEVSSFMGSSTIKGFIVLISYFLSVLLNFLLPSVILVKLIKLKRSIRQLGTAKGEAYEDNLVPDKNSIEMIVNTI